MSFLNNAAPLHITIGSATASPDNFASTLKSDLRLLKVALLYADQVKLCGIGSTVALDILRLRHAKFDDILRLWDPIIELQFPDPTDARRFREGIQLLQALERKPRNRRTPDDSRMLFFWKNLTGSQIDSFRKLAEDLTREYGTDELVEAIKSGVVELHTFPLYHPNSDDTLNAFVQEFVDVVIGSVLNGSTFPLFDEPVSNLVRLAIREGRVAVSESGITRGRQSGLAASLLQYLPSLEEATISEILEIRRDLYQPLTRFRGAIAQFSDKIKNAAWDEDFAFDADNVFRRDVRPAVQDLEYQIDQHTITKIVRRRLIEKPILAGTGVAGASVLGVSLMSSFEWPTVVSSLAVGTYGGVGLVTAIIDGWKQKQQTAQQHNLYFYLKAKQRLSNRSC